MQGPDESALDVAGTAAGTPPASAAAADGSGGVRWGSGNTGARTVYSTHHWACASLEAAGEEGRGGEGGTQSRFLRPPVV